MPALTAPALAAATLLALAGAQKLLDPTMTVGALRSLHLPSFPVLVRAGSAVELALGVAAASIGGSALWVLVAFSYSAFAVFVLVALRAGTMLGSCGCFGREDTPPNPIHVGLNLVLAGFAGAAARWSPTAPVEVLIDHPGQGVVVAGLVALAVYLLYAAYVVLPRTLAATR